MILLPVGKKVWSDATAMQSGVVWYSRHADRCGVVSWRAGPGTRRVLLVLERGTKQTASASIVENMVVKRNTAVKENTVLVAHMYPHQII